MKNYKILVAALAVGMALVATERPAEATLSVNGTAYLTQGNGASPVLRVIYSAVDTTLWTYTYAFTVGNLVDGQFTAGNANPVDSFTVDASFVNVPSVTSLDGTPNIVVNSDSVVWNYGITQIPHYGPFGITPPLSDTVSFTSAYGPTFGGASGNDGAPSVSWSSASPNGTPVPVPAPVPEASTVMAGALMLLPFGIGAIRSLRKERAV